MTLIKFSRYYSGKKVLLFFLVINKARDKLQKYKNLYSLVFYLF